MKNEPVSLLDKTLKILNKYKFILFYILCVFILQRLVLKMLGKNAGELEPGMNFIDPKRTTHRDTFDLDIDYLKSFRIYYGSGGKQTEFGDEYGYYELEGGQKKLQEAGIYEELREILVLVNQATIDSTGFGYRPEGMAGKAEYVYIRMKFDDPVYSKLNEVMLGLLIDEDAGKFPPFNEYIILLHSETTQYYIRRSGHPELLEKLYGIALRDYEPFMGKRWH